VNAALAEVREFWRDLLSGVQVATPSPELDVVVNGWLSYQNLSCRVWGRSAFYQSGGAFGFRDQLQDAAALVHLMPDLTRRQILLHAAHQFVEGDVLHWWHPPAGKGIRTRFADDLQSVQDHITVSAVQAEQSPEPLSFLHLRDAVTLLPSGATFPHRLWRGRFVDVTGWTLGKI
jgi:cellobiose phosphorylase